MNRFLKTTVLALMACGLSTPAWAALTLSWGDTFGVVAGAVSLTGAGSGTCADTAGCDTAAAGDSVTVAIAGLGNITVSSFAGTGGSPNGFLTFSINATPANAGTWYFAVSDTDFSNPIPPMTLTQTVDGNSATGGPTGTVEAAGLYDASNLLFGVGTGSDGCATSAASIAPGTLGTACADDVAGASPYSLTTVIRLNVTAIGTGLNQALQINGDLSTTPVPEPGSMFLLGGALLVTGKLVRKKLAKA